MKVENNKPRMMHKMVWNKKKRFLHSKSNKKDKKIKRLKMFNSNKRNK